MIYEFQATQSYNGYDKPWAPGAEGNIFNFENSLLANWISADGTLSTNTRNAFMSEFIEIHTDLIILEVFSYRTYYSPTNVQISEFDSTKTFIKRTLLSNVGTVNHTITLVPQEETVYVQIGAASQSILVLTLTDIDNFQLSLNVGEAPTAYYPYQNICMPEGFNIWNPTNQEYVQVYAGYVNANTRELYLRPVYEEYAGEELVGPWMSSLDPYEEDTTPTEGAFVIDFGGELTSLEITPFMLQTLLDSLGIRQHFTDGAGLLNKLMDQAQGRVRSEEELLHISRPLNVIAIGDQLPAGLTFKPISKDVLPGLPGKFIR